MALLYKRHIRQEYIYLNVHSKPPPTRFTKKIKITGLKPVQVIPASYTWKERRYVSCFVVRHALTRIFCGIGGRAHVGGGAGGGPSTRCGILRRFNSALVWASTCRCCADGAGVREGVPGVDQDKGGGDRIDNPTPGDVTRIAMSDGREVENRRGRSDPIDCKLARFLCIAVRATGD